MAGRGTVGHVHGPDIQGVDDGLAGLDPPHLRFGPVHEPGGQLDGEASLLAQVGR
jgi:hypothetical protein